MLGFETDSSLGLILYVFWLEIMTTRESNKILIKILHHHPILLPHVLFPLQLNLLLPSLTSMHLFLHLLKDKDDFFTNQIYAQIELHHLHASHFRFEREKEKNPSELQILIKFKMCGYCF